MDLRIFLRVLVRFKLLIAAGFLVALCLSALSIFRIGADGVSYRERELWGSTSRVLVTQPGFPWGRSLFLSSTALNGAPDSGAETVLPFASTQRFIELAVFYSQLVGSDDVQRLMAASGVPFGTVTGAATSVGGGSREATLPIIAINAIAETPGDAVRFANIGSTTLRKYVAARQERARIPRAQRAAIHELNVAAGAEVVQERKLTTPIALFIIALTAVLGLAFALENLRPAIREVPKQRLGAADERQFRESA